MVESVKCDISGYGSVGTAERKIPDPNVSVKCDVNHGPVQ
jgi:hypothetical protein